MQYLKTTRSSIAVFVVFCAFSLIGPARAATIFVDDDANPGGDGTTWQTAFKYLQDALAVAFSGDEIHVAQGTYKPDQDGAGNVTCGDREATFQLISGVALYGGFPPGGGDFADRDPEAYETILSGDLAGNDAPNFEHNDENSYHVLKATNLASDAVLDGFTVTAGNADEPFPSQHRDGGGIYLENGSPRLANCTFKANAAYSIGGALCVRDGSPSIVRCTFAENSARFSSGAHGGAIGNLSGSPSLFDCVVCDNYAVLSGGGLSTINYGSYDLVNCLLINNGAGLKGGALNVSSYSIGRLYGCTLSGNHAGVLGGGLYASGDHVAVDDCILWGNADAGGMDESAQIHVSGGTVAVNYCCIEGWTGNLGGEGNIGAEPRFVDPDGPDDDPDTWDDNDYHLACDSPCIDAGDNQAVPADILDLDGDGDTDEPTPFDLDGAPRFIDDPDTDDSGNGMPPIVDMGAYEFQGGIVTFLDIKPGSCPNSFNRHSHGVLPAALLGTADIDAAAIDVSSILLARADGIGGSVAPHEGPPGPHSVFEDVGTPFDGEWCDCHDLEGDGITDLMMHFKTDDVVEALELNDLDPGALVELVVSGNLLDGTAFTASDCIRLVPPGTAPGLLYIESSPSGAWIDASPLDETLDGGGFADFERTYPLTTVVSLTAEETFGDRRFTRWFVDGVPQPVNGLTIQVTIDEVGHNLTAKYRQPTDSGHQLGDHLPTVDDDLSR